MIVGIIGSGNISHTHARAAAGIAGVRVAAVCGRTIDKATQLAQPYGAAAYDDLDRFLDHRPLDLVLIGSPSGLHAEQGMLAAERGLHLLVEKPLDITTKRADALIEAAERARVKLGVFFQDRLEPDIVRMKALIDEGAIGRPVLTSARVKWYRPPEYYARSSWRGTWALDGGGALMNQGIHTVDLLLSLMGPIVGVFGRTATQLHDIEVEDTATAILEFANGAIGSLEASTAVFPGYPRRLEVTGTEGTLVLEDSRLVACDLKTTEKAGPASSPRSVLGATNATSPVVADASAHQRVIEDFLRAIRDDKEPACSGREGRRCVEVVQAIYTSSRERRRVAVPR